MSGCQLEYGSESQSVYLLASRLAFPLALPLEFVLEFLLASPSVSRSVFGLVC